MVITQCHVQLPCGICLMTSARTARIAIINWHSHVTSHLMTVLLNNVKLPLLTKETYFSMQTIDINCSVEVFVIFFPTLVQILLSLSLPIYVSFYDITYYAD